MIARLFERKASREAEVLAEAQAFLEDGLDLEAVLGLFPEDAVWLGGMLSTGEAIAEACATEPASFYFEASLKSRVLAAAAPVAPVPAVIPLPGYSPVRTAAASMGVVSAAAVVGVLALGFVTADNAVPGDWNYSFKRVNERLEYTFSHGDGRVDVQLRQTEARVYELQELAGRGQGVAGPLDDLQREVASLAELATRQGGLNEVQKARVKSIAAQTTTVLTEASKSPEVDPEQVAAAAAAIDTAVTTALAATELPPVSPTPSPTATVTPTETPTVTPTETALPNETPVPSPTSETVTPPAEASATVQPLESDPTGSPTP